MNIERSLIQAVNDEERVLVRGSWGQGLEWPPAYAGGPIYSDLYPYDLMMILNSGLLFWGHPV